MTFRWSLVTVLAKTLPRYTVRGIVERKCPAREDRALISWCSMGYPPLL